MLKQMKTEWGCTIVDRTPKGLTFTAEGNFLAAQAEKYLELFHDTKEELKKLQDAALTEIVIGASYTYSKYSLADVLVPYQIAHPNIKFRIVNDSSDALYRQVLDGSVDVGFLRGDYEGPVNRTLLGETRGFLVTKGAVEVSALPGLHRLDYKTNEKTTKILNRWWEMCFESAYPSGMMVGHIDGAWKLIDEGMGYALSFLPENFENRYQLTLTPLTWPDGTPVTRKTWFVYPKEKRLPEKLVDFIKYTESLAASFSSSSAYF
ncbi:hypothetical protein GPK90_00405 [Clostridium sp. MCC344]|nr:LysR family transcriptional regulator [Clostridium sp. MCC344]MBT9787833.1 hypothetical protein [Clostridium sp. MCC344]